MVDGLQSFDDGTCDGNAIRRDDYFVIVVGTDGNPHYFNDIRDADWEITFGVSKNGWLSWKNDQFGMSNEVQELADRR